MTRADAWLVDPFGGALGRWGGSASGGAPAPWYAPITDLIGAGFFVEHATGIPDAVGQPVSAWADVRGTPVYTQPGVTSLRPLRNAGNVEFDGIDDRLLADALAPLLEGAHTLVVGFDDPDDIGTGARTMVAAANTSSSGTLRQVSLNYSAPSSPNATRQRYYFADGTTGATISLVDLSDIGAGPYNLAFRNVGRGADTRADRLQDPLVQSGLTVTRPAGAEAYTWLTLGCRRIGATPTNTQFWLGKVRYVIAAPLELSDAQLEVVRATLSARGLL